MELPLSPPPLPLQPPPPPAPRRGRLGWAGHLFFLTAWLFLLIYVGHLRDTPPHRRVPLHSATGVLWTVLAEWVIFAVVCQFAWLCSRATGEEWRLRWRGGFGPVWRGALYSVGFRVALLIGSVAVVLTLVALRVVDPQDTGRFRPHVENLVSLDALVHDRVFFWCTVTLLSATAGVVEEVWRAGMLAGLAGVLPGVFGGRAGRWFAVVPVAVLFGLGHLYMGWPAVAGTTVLGLMLGAVMVAHGTIWDAVIAHALFDAGSFVLLAAVTQRNPHLLGQ